MTINLYVGYKYKEVNRVITENIDKKDSGPN